jgi:hypothetical protein
VFNDYVLVQSGQGVIDLDGAPRSRPFVGDANADGVLDILLGASDGFVRQYNGVPQGEAESAAGTGGAASDGDYVYTFQVDSSAEQNPWQCPQDRLDVNNDGYITALDALLLINHMGVEGPGPLPAVGESGTPPLYVDCSGNGEMTPLDILLVVRDINLYGPREAGASEPDASCELDNASPSSCQAEGESGAAIYDDLADFREPLIHWHGSHFPRKSR